MASTTRTAIPAPFRSTAEIPLRPPRLETYVSDTHSGRIPLALAAPSTPGGIYRPSAFSGEAVPFRVTAFREGHDLIGVHVRLFSPSGVESLHRLSPLNDGFDRWSVLISPLEQGIWTFRFEGFADEFATWEHAADLKIAAGVDTTLMREMGARLFAAAAVEKSRPAAERRALTAAAASLRDESVSDIQSLEIVRDHAIAEYFAARPVQSLLTLGPTMEVLVERERAGSGSWYEFFPRSEGAKRAKDGSIISGTFRTAAKRLPAVADMGFDVLYLPPIHPIGERNRKGPNNTLVTKPGDPGSPWAIGSAAGGHDVVHPDLGTLADFRAFVRAAARRRSRGGARPGTPGRSRPPVGHRAPRVVHHPCGWFDRLRREPAEEVPGHLSDQLRQRPRGHSRRSAANRAALDQAGREDLPGGQPAHQAPAVLGVAHCDRGRQASRCRLSRRSLHAAGTHASVGHGGFPAELLVLHLAQHKGGARGVPRVGGARDVRFHASEPLRQHPRHPHRVPPIRWPPGVQDPRGDRGDGRCVVRRLCRLRALRERRAARRRREHRQREIRIQDPRLGSRGGRRQLARPIPATSQRDPQIAPRPAATAKPLHPLERRRGDSRLREAPAGIADRDGAGRHGDRHRQRRPALRSPDRWCTSTRRCGESPPAPRSMWKTSSRGRPGRGRITTSSGWTPSTNPCTFCT